MQNSVVFGWELDGPRFPESTHGNDAIGDLGNEILGPIRLLELLELRLGLGSKPSSEALRTAQYLSRLKHVDDGNQFYSRSFNVDPWGTAAYLLSKREELLAGGWSSQMFNGASDRLRTFCSLERCVELPVSKGLAERLSEIRLALSRAGKGLLDQILMVTPFGELPSEWQSVFLTLAKKGVHLVNINRSYGLGNDLIPHSLAEPAAPSIYDLSQPELSHRNDLSEMHRAANNAGDLKFTGDGSFVVIECDNEIQASEFVAAWLKADVEMNKSLVIIRGDGTAMLDESCHRFGLPRIGGKRRSRFRGAMQVLPLWIEILWTPLNPLRLLEFLNLTHSPIPGSIAWIFSEALREEPGVGGAAWKSAWEKAEKYQREYLNELDAQIIEKQVRSDLRRWRRWLEHKQYDPQEGIPCEYAQTLCRQVESWALQRSEHLGDALFGAAAACSASLAESIAFTHTNLIPRVQMERIIDHVYADGISIHGGGAEASEWSSIDRPGQLWGPAKTVLWWGFTGGEERGTERFWTEEERRAIESAGITIPNQSLDKLRDAASWRRAVQNVQEQLLVVIPRSVKGQVAHPHPFWHEIKVWLEGCDAGARSRIFVNVADCYSKPEISVAGRTLQFERAIKTLPPVPKREWRISAELVKPLEELSFTSMESSLRCPLAFVLSYTARLHPGTLLDLPEDERLMGNLSHSLVARLFEKKNKWTKREAQPEALSLFDELVPAIAPSLLQPGKSLELKRFRRIVEQSVGVLIDLLNDAGLHVVGCEVKRTAPFNLGTFMGTIDLVCQDPSGRTVVVDLKWTKSAKYRRCEIAEGRALQLAAYSWLESCASGQQPNAGYFMLKQARMFQTAKAPFPADTHVAGSDLNEVWSQAKNGYELCLSDLWNGRIVAAGIGEEANESLTRAPLRKEVLKLEPPCRVCTFSHICGKSQQVSR